MANYIPCNASDLPPGIRFDTNIRDQGQIVEIAYGGFDRVEHGPGDPYMRRIDRSVGQGAVEYYRLA